VIRSVLNTFLIPGYVAYEWKYQWGIPIMGTEDPVLYRSSARLWCEIQGKNDLGQSAMWSATVAGRNACMVRALVAQTSLHECPFLFLGGKHLESPAIPEGLSAEDWYQARNTMPVAEVGRLCSAGPRSVVGLLRERSIGFYFLAARGPALRDGKQEARRIQRYAALFRAQMAGQVDSYVREVAGVHGGVTVAPSPEAAALFLAAHADSGSSNESVAQGGGNQGGGDDNQDPKIGGLVDRLIDAIKKMLGQKGSTQGGHAGDLPAKGVPGSTGVTDHGDGKGTIRDTGSNSQILRVEGAAGKREGERVAGGSHFCDEKDCSDHFFCCAKWLSIIP
jgi:hypothetical protein